MKSLSQQQQHDLSASAAVLTINRLEYRHLSVINLVALNRLQQKCDVGTTTMCKLKNWTATHDSTHQNR
jgi:hypothetical protein